MLRKSSRIHIYIALCVILGVVFTVQASAIGPRSDLSYTFSNRTRTEFYNSGTTMQYNITEGLPGWVSGIIDLTPQPVHNSEFGINIVLPGCNFSANPAAGRPNTAPPTAPAVSSPPSQANSFPAGAPVTRDSSDVAFPNSSFQPRSARYPGFTHEANVNPHRLTPVAEVRQSDGSIGTLVIPRIGLNMRVYGGDIDAAMLRGAGHISSTSAWNGNIGVTAHNRGVPNNFGRLNELVAGDIIQYTTSLGTRQYRVVSISRVDEFDWSKLQFTTDNRITLLTCIANVPTQRLIVQGVQISD